MSTQVITSESIIASPREGDPATLLARLERLPVTRRLLAIRVVVGLSTFFDAYTIIAIAFALPQLTQEWGLTPTFIGADHCRKLCWAALRRTLFWLSGRKNWPHWRVAYHHCDVRRDGCRLPVCLEWMVDSGYPFPARIRNRGRSSGCQRLYQ